jgi:ATP-dependent DNA helicase 2 subunit 1
MSIPSSFSSFRTLGTSFPSLPPIRYYWAHGSAIIKFLGFIDESELAFEDNVKHSFFVYPDEMVRSCCSLSQTPPDVLLFYEKVYSGSKRTFSALLRLMFKKKKIGMVLALMRRNSSPIFCAMLPQVS